jgi:thiopurine S-methyltransferase
MEPEFWLERWQRGEIGFHQDELNPHLRRFWHQLGIAANACVFVPLCGKSKDMEWLHERGHAVWGIEISPVALEAFFQSPARVPTIRQYGELTLYTAQRYNLFLGDYFALEPVHIPHIGAVYDRASLVALPPQSRQRYAQQMARLLPPGTQVLLISVDYPAEQMQGPPFAVSGQQIHALYGAMFDVRELEARNVLDDNPRFRERGVTRLEERVYVLVRNNNVAG